MAHTEQLTNNEPIAIMPSTSINGTGNYTQPMVDEPDHFDDDEDFIINQDSLEHIDIQHSSIQSVQSNHQSSRGSSLSVNSNGFNGHSKKSGKDILEFETGNAEDPWKDDPHHIDNRVSVTNLDYQPPCPW
eukprot:CAMPEP_0201570812 /NCGR_PEP_ID=MMETSP0190_2-20130828/13227_1 /ASSEMBLY_ACC=CAM_ASM_000263 /TAXON_ID=37353 /ORGANISM="Rosalina sp." /LENGTH=130 /DNA_ID=CAMNT_0047994743 /DNA_START=22 /DNA_END=411 /DNA_ORIENTATION=+